jgi:membrane-bound lytic murein transglycosylase A
VDGTGAVPVARLMVAQDTGSAIKGVQRGDIFFGSGDEAGEIAGRMKAEGELIALLPKEIAP